MSIQIQLERIFSELATLKNLIQAFRTPKTERSFFTTDEAAELLKKSAYTIREHCRNGRIHATKRMTGRGKSQDWAISKEEITRIQNEGLLPLRKR